MDGRLGGVLELSLVGGVAWGAAGFAWLAACGLATDGLPAGDCAATITPLKRRTYGAEILVNDTDMVTLSRISNLRTLRGVCHVIIAKGLRPAYLLVS